MDVLRYGLLYQFFIVLLQFASLLRRVSMKKVAMFGNAGGGKSTLSKRLSDITGLPLHVLDKIKYQSGGAEVPYEEYKHTHEKILATDRWIIDGFGCMETVWL